MYQNSRFARAFAVTKSDTLDIPFPGGESMVGVAAATTANKLEIAGGFHAAGIAIGDYVMNTTDSTNARVTVIDSDTVISLSADIFADTEAFKIIKKVSDNSCRLFVGVAGAVAVITAGGDSVVFKGVPAGSILPVLVTRLLSTGTTATDVVALW